MNSNYMRDNYFVLLLGLVSIFVINSKLIAGNPDLDNSNSWSPPPCSGFIDTSNIELTIENCDLNTGICLRQSLGDMNSYTITDNGNPYTGGLSACDFDSLFAYTYFGVPGGGLDGPYMVDQWSVDGNLYTGQVDSIYDLVDSMNVWDPSGNWVIDESTSSIRGGLTSTAYGDLDIIQISSGMLESIEITTSLNPNGTMMTLDTGYHELIFMEPVDGCLDTVIVLINCIPCSSFYSGPTNFAATDCSDETSICLDIPLDEFADYNITDNGFPYSFSVQSCDSDTLCSYNYSSVPGGGTVGPYLLQNWTVNGSVFIGGFNTIAELTDSMNVWDPGTGWILNETDQLIQSTNCSNTYGNLQIMQIISGTSVTLSFNTAEYSTGSELVLDTGNHDIAITNTNNLCAENINILIECNPCVPIFDGTPMMLEADHCDSLTAVCVALPFSESGDYDWTINGIPYTGTFATCGGGETEILLDTGFHHLVVTDPLFGCQDSVDITINCVPVIPCTDFIATEAMLLSVNDCAASAGFCVEIPVANLPDYTIIDNGAAYTGSTAACNGNQLETELELSTGVHQLIFTHTTSNCKDTLNVTVICISNATENITILANESDVFCPDLSELPGNVVSIENVCSDDSGEFVLFETDNNSFCVDYTGVEAGTETACIVICDNLGYCDTTFVNITVEPVIVDPDPLPVATDDTGVTEVNQTVEIDILANDEINGTLAALHISSLPANGIVSITNNRLFYMPLENTCNSTIPDQLTYTLCNEFGCDVATVSILVNCEEIKAFSGFSPNNDGKNDSFVIAGLHDYPDHELFVYNKWGVQVLKTRNYGNDWDGTWEGVTLPDGTYFYVFDTGKGQLLSGFVQIQR